MLLNLSITNFAIVSHVEIDWQQGMTTITGETGAGKSIAIDALGLCLGARALSNAVRPGCDKAELTASFEISNNKSAIKWLNSNDLNLDDDCIIRRVINKEGRSKSYINGSAVPLAQLKNLGQLLINIHGQHDHQLIMKNTEQRHLLDDYANHKGLLEELKLHQKNWRALKQEHSYLEQQKQHRLSEQQLLQYQVKELDEFALQATEFIQLESDYKRNSNAQQLLQMSAQCCDLLAESEQQSALSILQTSSDSLNQLAEIDPSAQSIATLINEARIQVEEASRDLNYYQQNIDIDPQAFAIIEERYSTAVLLARKHQVAPENLVDFHISLLNRLESIEQDDSRLDTIGNDLQTCLEQYQECAQRLRKSRNKSAKILAKRITKSLHELSMPDARFTLGINDKDLAEPSIHGIDEVEFLVSMNPGQPLEPIQKVASGGELSRISLAIQVILAEKVITPTLIFDEVDVGISGPTAAKVGQQLQLLSANTQVICVTHLPQVACKGHQQLFVSKITDGKKTQTNVSSLDKQMRTQEIARLLAGDSITEHSLANAEELLTC